MNATFAEIDNDSRYDDADVISQFLDSRVGEWFSPSQVARKVKMDTLHVRSILDFMVAQRFAISSGNGAWTKYAGWTSR